MKKDIPFEPVEGVSIAIVPDQEALNPAGLPIWQVYLLNHNSFPLENVIVNAHGYGEQEDGEKVRTSTLRYLFQEVPPHAAVLVEPLDPGLFHLNNQYWVSYFRGSQMLDKKYIFVPDSIVPDNFTHISLLDRIGVLHS
ncbi:hypothetical protein Q5H93_01270 [Hymenobacter sp. ASUV-10]|uniref:Uncharacterized protein n=1 Tax=Hymenobacter aranciens TaxID=3063996 RepID=A0ABT9B8L0_9BACT|nr:hypothetical protein [Hymenobacter sp. ASUV-10]MDO7873342.1 hypothetical protein [Hymenobacter sp. ASUV-10]